MHYSKNGFTLIELVVVMAIIAIIATLGVGAIIVARNTARLTVHKKNAEVIHAAFESYLVAHGVYPTLNKSFDGAAEILNVTLSATPECTVLTHLGGGGVWNTATGYRIVTYAADCNTVMSGIDYP